MKVTEIIMSNSIQESTPVDIVKGIRKMADLPVSVRNTAKTTKAAEKIPPQVEPKTSWLDKLTTKIDTARAEKAKKILAQRQFAIVSKHYGEEALAWLKWANLLAAATEYWWKSSELDTQLSSGAIDQQTYDQEIIKLRGLAITQWIAPKIGYWVANKVAAITLVKQLPRLIKFLRMPNAAAILKDFSKPAVQAAIVAFVMTPAGKQWLMDTVGAFVIGVGSIPTLAGKIWDVVQGVYDAAVNGETDNAAATPNTASGGNSEVDSTATPADKKTTITPKKSMPYNMSISDLGY